MQCHNHEIQAVATCKNCYKAICRDCLSLVNGICACKNSCEQAVTDLEEYLSLSKQSIKKISNTYKNGAIFNFICGLVFLIIGIAPVITGSNYGVTIFAVLGLAFFYGSYASYKGGKRLETNEKAQRRTGV
ncbi:hypothetical protein FIV02_06790 [Pseudomonas sp. THAF187a]|uniref:hypothetical protein n=1 Tax=unclassified Pseudomonas TaxID=196821 RepID=UPI0012698184|nr:MULTISPECIES: hypothetical protein [unclassified Pseudomonas]QFT21285.1 hypothetical protein FIV02_06790 [Pseudomonas sp. THAF187a]QFT41473.1 hypothetical protein FIU98_06775 [Pseudomonas sp. THAF42]